MCKHFSAMICYDFWHGLTLQQCIDSLNYTFGDETLSKTAGLVNLIVAASVLQMNLIL